MRNCLFRQKLSIILALTSLLISSCSNVNEEKLTYSIDLEKLLAKELIIDSLFRVDKVIQLETTEESLIKYISKIFLSEDWIVIADDFGNSVLVFDQYGAFVSRISNQGGAPGEYLRLSDIFVDFGEGIVYILDGFESKKMLKFSLAGEFIEELNIEFGAGSFIKIDDNSFAFFLTGGTNFSDNYEFSALLVTDSVYQKKWTGIPFEKKWAGYSYLSAFTNTVFPSFSNEAFFVPSLPHNINKVYKFSSASVEPYLEINPDNNQELLKLLETIDPKKGGEFRQIQQASLWYNLNSFFETDKFITFSISKGGNRYYVVHEKGSDEYKINQGDAIDKHHGFFDPYPSNSEILINEVGAMTVLENDFSLFASIKSKLKADDNPILVIYTAK